MNEFVRQTRERAAPAYQPARSPSVHAERAAGGELHSAAELGFSLGNMSIYPKIQAKLTVGPVNDQYEQEADRVAEQAVSMAEPASLQRQGEDEDEELQAKPLADGITSLAQRQVEEEEEEKLQAKPLAEGITPLVQRQEPEDEELQMAPDSSCPECEREIQQEGLEGARVVPDLEQSINQARGSGVQLADGVRGRMEGAFGVDLGSVRIHSDANADRLNRSIQARAFTAGHDIFIRQGEYRPGSSEGDRLLAHEMTHVVQQNSGQLQRIQPNGMGQALSIANSFEGYSFGIQKQFNIQRRADVAVRPLAQHPGDTTPTKKRGIGSLDWGIYHMHIIFSRDRPLKLTEEIENSNNGITDNVGFHTGTNARYEGPGRLFSEDWRSLGYTFYEPISNDQEDQYLVRAINNNKSPGPYNLKTNNCQTWVKKVINTFESLR